MRSARPVIVLSSALAAATVLAACSSSGSAGAGGATTSTAGSSAVGSSVAGSSVAGSPVATTNGRTITATLTEFHIALSRTDLTPGTYTFEVRNAGSITHALTVDGKGVDDRSTSDLDSGQSATLTVTLAKGRYEIYCPVGDHKMEGMDTTVQVG